MGHPSPPLMYGQIWPDSLEPTIQIQMAEKNTLNIIYLFRFSRVFGEILKYKHGQWHFIVERRKKVRKFISVTDNVKIKGDLKSTLNSF